MANYILLSRQTLSQSAASVTFSNIPQTGYTDLKIVVSARSDTSRASNGFLFDIRPNGSSSNMTRRSIYGDGATVASSSGTEGYNQLLNPSSYTASIFSSTEIYIPNYTSSSFKSMTTKTVAENNATEGFDLLGSEFWSVTSAITSLQFTPLAGNFVQYSTFSLYGLAAVGTTPVTYPKATGGDIIVNDGTYWYHAFLSTGVFTPKSTLSADAIIIGAGGAGGGDVGGGGGAGRVYGLTSLSMVAATNYACTVGAGGAWGANASGGLKGTDSSLIGGLLSYTALGGGGGQGRSYGTAALNNGWSGGGSSYDSSRPATAGNGGYSGGTTSGFNSNPCYCGGGGGTTSAGTNSTNGGTSGGAGTSTYSSWASATGTGVGGAYAGGGGGGNYGVAGYRSYGQAGGGYGSYNDAASAATVNTGSGGGGAGSSQYPGLGGSGIVIIRYTMA